MRSLILLLMFPCAAHAQLFGLESYYESKNLNIMAMKLPVEQMQCINGQCSTFGLQPIMAPAPVAPVVEDQYVEVTVMRPVKEMREFTVMRPVKEMQEVTVMRPVKEMRLAAPPVTMSYEYRASYRASSSAEWHPLFRHLQEPPHNRSYESLVGLSVAELEALHNADHARPMRRLFSGGRLFPRLFQRFRR